MIQKNSTILRFVAFLLVSLAAACSSGGGGTAGGASTTPAPTATTATTATMASTGPLSLGPFARPNIGAPVAASLGGRTPLTASATTPNFAVGPTAGTVFPLNQSVLESDPLGGVYGLTYTGGATLTYQGSKQVNGTNVGIYAFQFGNVNITLTADGTGVTIPGSGNTMVGLVTQNLNYTLLAAWVIPDNNGLNVSDAGAGISGYQTPGSGVPTSGTATYLGNGASSGGVTGMVVNQSGVGSLTGNVTANVNFATGSINGALTNMNVTAGGATVPWNNVNLSGSLSGAAISGSTAASSSPAGGLSLSAGATGTFNGALYGPTGQELGAVWSLYDSTGGGKSALGLLSATKQ